MNELYEKIFQMADRIHALEAELAKEREKSADILVMSKRRKEAVRILAHNCNQLVKDAIYSLGVYNKAKAKLVKEQKEKHCSFCNVKDEYNWSQRERLEEHCCVLQEERGRLMRGTRRLVKTLRAIYRKNQALRAEAENVKSGEVSFAPSCDCSIGPYGPITTDQFRQRPDGTIVMAIPSCLRCGKKWKAMEGGES